MAVYSYARVSTTMQADEGESLGAQRRRIEGYAMQLDLSSTGTSSSAPSPVRASGGTARGAGAA